MSPRTLNIGAQRSLDGGGYATAFALPAHHLVTHGVITGMTGSGKTGLLMVTIEEAVRAGIPVLMLDVKGDLPNVLLAFPSLDAGAYLPWLDPESPANDGRPLEQVASELAQARREELGSWGLREVDVAEFRARLAPRIITPGTTAGEPLHVLSSLERRSPRWDSDAEAARDALGAAVSLVLRLLGRDPDPARSREHVLLSLLAERRARAGQSSDLGALLADLENPPFREVGALAIDAFLPRNERRALAAALDALIASPSFANWREGATLDPGAWLARRSDGRTPAVIVSVAHLDDEERHLVLGVLFEELLAWVRGLPGTTALRALVVFDEVAGFLPPHPANPPSKRPLVALMKQARAYGVGVVLATQNPMDLDYRALGNAGLWCVGRLQTDADRARVVEGLTGVTKARERAALSATLKQLAPRWFVVRDAQMGSQCVLVQPRCAMSWLRGPLTRGELRALRGRAANDAGGEP